MIEPRGTGGVTEPRGTADAPLFSRDQLMGGLPARRAASAVYAIENRTARLVARSRRAIERYVSEQAAAQEESAFLAALAAGRDPPLRPSIMDLEAHAADWASLVPADPALRAAVARQVGGKYRFRRSDVPRLRAALSLDDDAVATAFGRLFGEPLDSIYQARLTTRERIGWVNARIRDRLEHLSPAWIAFALTLTETVGAGVLALPIALAGVGLPAALGLLLVFGVVNLLTIIALVESINRNGSIRYGSAYFGRLVEDYLGVSGRAVQSLMLFVINALCVISYAFGVGSTLGSLSGTPPFIWVALLGFVTAAVLIRGSLNATVATAMIIGFTNIGLLIAISAAGLAHLDAGRALAQPSVNGFGALTLVFGVVLTAYYGHSSVGTAAKLVLARDPSGRSLMRGAVAAMATAMLLYGLVVTAVIGAVPASDLVGFAGTAIEPLARAVGPTVSVFGAAFVVLAMGQATVLCSLALFSQARESVGERPAVAAHTGLSSLIAVAPVVAMFLVVPLLMSSGNATFTGPIAVLGTIGTPILGGVIPMLILLAARRRAEYATAVAPRFLAHPATVALIAGLYCAGILFQGWIISSDPLMRVGTLIAAIAVGAIAVQALRTGAFRPRAVLELRGEDAGRVRYALVDGGDPAPIHAVGVAAGSSGDDRPSSAAGTLGVGWLERADLATGTRLQLEVRAAEELLVWAHRVTDDGDSLPLGLHVSLGADGDAGSLDLTSGRQTLSPATAPWILIVRGEAARTGANRPAGTADNAWSSLSNRSAASEAPA